MKRFAWVVAVALAVATTISTAATPPLEVSVEGGRIGGRLDGTLATFQGIRYAAPPVTAGMGTAPCLMGVTTVHKTGEPAPAMLWQAYGYAPSGTDGKPYLSTVSVPNPSGDANYTTATIVYDAGIVSYLMDANENRRVYRYEPDGTRVTVSSKDGKVADTFLRHIDAQGRNRGKTDAAGNRSTLNYGDTIPL